MERKFIRLRFINGSDQRPDVLCVVCSALLECVCGGNTSRVGICCPPALSGETRNGITHECLRGLTVTTHWQQHHRLSLPHANPPNNASDSFPPLAGALITWIGLALSPRRTTMVSCFSFLIYKKTSFRYAEIMFISICFAYTDVHRASSQIPKVAEPKALMNPLTGGLHGRATAPSRTQVSLIQQSFLVRHQLSLIKVSCLPAPPS